MLATHHLSHTTTGVSHTPAVAFDPSSSMNASAPLSETEVPPVSHPLYEKLTAAEQRVAQHVAQGFSNKEIAEALGKAEPTVKHQVSSILRKAGVPSRARLIALLR